MCEEAILGASAVVGLAPVSSRREATGGAGDPGEPGCVERHAGANVMVAGSAEAGCVIRFRQRPRVVLDEHDLLCRGLAGLARDRVDRGYRTRRERKWRGPPPHEGAAGAPAPPLGGPGGP